MAAMLADAPIVLASGSATRAAMLRAAGLEVVVDPASVDEDEVKLSLKAAGARVEDVAEALAELKAQRISARRPGLLVVGADQMLECEGVWFDKPTGRDAAKAQLKALAGRTHRLVSCAVVCLDGARIWHRTDTARLTLRPLSDAFLDRYLDAAGEAVCTSVGAYQVEGLGAQLFARIEGAHATILGLPLLPLLDFLRTRGVLPS